MITLTFIFGSGYLGVNERVYTQLTTFFSGSFFAVALFFPAWYFNMDLMYVYETESPFNSSQMPDETKIIENDASHHVEMKSVQTFHWLVSVHVGSWQYWLRQQQKKSTYDHPKGTKLMACSLQNLFIQLMSEVLSSIACFLHPFNHFVKSIELKLDCAIISN